MKLISFCLLFVNIFFANTIDRPKSVRLNGEYALAPLSGTYTIPGDFATINDAAQSLNLNGVSGPVVFNVAANHIETAPSGTSATTPGGIVFGNIVGTNSTNTITFQKNGVGTNPIVTAGANHFAGGIMDAVIKLVGTDFLLFDRIDVRENPLNTNTTVATNNMTEFGFGLFYANPVATANGAQNNIIQNATITLNTGSTNYQNTFGIYSSTANSSTNGTGASSVTTIAGSNSNNRLYGNTISNCNFGITIIGSNTPAAMDTGWDIGGSSALTGNTITNFGIGNGVAASAYQKLGITVQGILINQIANNRISYNTIISSPGTSTTTIIMVGVFIGWSGTMVQPPTNTSTCSYNSIQITNVFSETTVGIWSRIGNSTSSKTLNNNTISIINTSTISVINKFMRGIYQDVLIGELITSNNTITMHYENADHAHALYFIQADVEVSLNRQANFNILQTPVGKNLRTSGIVSGISHSGLSLGTLSINDNTISINKGNVTSTAAFAGIISSSSASTATSYTINSNSITLTASATTNGNTTLVGINSQDGTSTTNKTISQNQITINGLNIGGFSLGITVARCGILTCQQNSITITNFSPSLFGIFSTTGCTTNNIDNNIIVISPINMPVTSAITGISNTVGLPNIIHNDITIAPTVSPVALTTITSIGINNSILGGVISNNTKIRITPSSTENTIVVNLPSTGIYNSGPSQTISGNNSIEIYPNTLTGNANCNGINNLGAGSTISNNNDITISNNAYSTSTCQAILNSAASANIQNNNRIDIQLTVYGVGNVYGITNSGATTTISQNERIEVVSNSNIGGSRVYGINNTGISAVISINPSINVTANSITTTTYARGIYSSVPSTISGNSSILVNSNSGSISASYGIYSIGTINNNSMSVNSNSVIGIDNSCGIQVDGNSNVFNNTVNTNFSTNNGNVIAYGINSNNANSTVSNNIIYHRAESNGNDAILNWFATISGIRSFGINNIIEGNRIEEVYSSMGRGTTIYEVSGIVLESAENAMVNNNIISNVSSNGTADNRTYISGIYALTGTLNPTIKNNRIFNISLNNNVTGVHPGPGIVTGQPIPANTNGIWVRLSFNTTLNNYKIYNNHISKLFNPSASALGGIFGMTLSSREVNHLVYNNTIVIGDNTTQVTSNILGNFGGTAVGFINRIGSGLTDLRNNILYVNIVPKGTGYVSALAAIKNHDEDIISFTTNPGQTTVRPPNYHPSSNNNLFYAPVVPNARSYFYCEGNGFGTEYNRFSINHNTTSINDSNINVTPFTGCTSKYKTLMNGGASNFGSDSNSYFDNVILTEGSGTDVGYWTPSGETYAELGAQVLAIEYDLDSKNTSRGSNPDMGALQFSAILPLPPIITYGPLTVPGSCGGVFSSLTLDNVHIVDVAGVPTTGALVPRLYYQVNSGSYISVPGTLTSGTGFDGYWSFTLTGLVAGTINYYVIAQDRLTKITSNPSAGLQACNVNNVTTHPTNPNTITMGGSIAIYSLGTWSSPPTISKTVIFDDDFNSTVDIEACSVLVKAGRTVVFNSVHSLLVQNEVTVEPSGNLIFENNSKLVQIANVANSGTINYKRIASVKKFDYVYWSSPVASFNLDNLNLLLPTGPKFKWEPLLPNPNGGIGYWINSQGNTMTLSRGYIVRSPENYSTTVAAPFLSTFIGVPNNGNISYTIERGPMTAATLSSYTSANGIPLTEFDDNWNLIGNPYPSAISANHFLYENRETNGGFLAGFVNIWRHGIDIQTGVNNPFYGSYQYNYDTNDYLTYNLVGATCCPTVGDYKIGAGQGFFVQMIEGSAASGNVNFNNSMRRDFSNIPHNNTIFYRNSYEPNDYLHPERHRIWLDLIGHNNQVERTLVGYIDGATYDYDSFYDVPVGFKNTLDFYSLIGDKHHKTQGRTLPFDSNDEVPLGINCPQRGEYTIAIAALDGLFETQTIFLKDLTLNTSHNLKLSPYTFSSENGYFNNRFVLVYQNTTLETIENTSLNSISVFSLNNQIRIKSTKSVLDEVKIYDISGRLLFQKNNINSYELLVSDCTKSDQLLLIEIKTEDGTKEMKKVTN